jgi:PPOX class probable F420-dependent enzyme
MGKQRDAIRMSEAEVEAFVAECRNLQVATLDKAGAPHLTTVWFAYREGEFLFETYGSSQKIVNLRRDPRVAVLCEKGESYDELRGVSVQGRAEIVESGARADELMRAIISRIHPGVGPEKVGDLAAQMLRKRVVVVVRPEKLISWDHRKIAAAR